MATPSPFLADASLVEALNKLASPVPCPGDTILFRQGDECVGLYVLRAGTAVLEMSHPSEGISARFETSSGSLLGLPAVLSGERYTLTAVAAKGSEVGFIARPACLQLLSTNPALSFMALQVMAAEIRACRAELLEVLIRKDSAQQN